MRFNDGFWALKAGVKPAYGLQVVGHRVADSACHLQVATVPIRHRGDTLKGPLLGVTVHAPSEDVIGVRIEHFKRLETFPEIALFPDTQASPKGSAIEREGSFDVVSGDLSAEITSSPYTITFKTGKKVVATVGAKHQAVIDVPYKWTLNSAANASCLTTDNSSNPNPPTPPHNVRYVHSELTISPGELFYGLGEQFGPLTKNGQSISMWNSDGGTCSEQAYKCVPFYISNKGYGLFANHPGEVEFEIGSEKISRVGISVADTSLEYFIIYGDTPLKILERFTQMTGRPALPPAWTFGLWLTTSFLTDYDEKTVSGFLKGMQDRDCNVRVFHFDCFWMKQYEWCSFTFDPVNFPNPKEYISEIKAKYGVKVCVWINPYISQFSPVFDEAVKGGYLIKRSNGNPWQWDLWQPGLGIVDFTNAAARKWYEDKLSGLIDLGVDCFKTDFGERIPHVDVKYHDGSEPMRMHNMYAVLYNDVVFSLLEKRFGKHEAVVFARSAAAGGQRFPVHWGGDCESTFEAMGEALRGCLSLSLSGFGFASHDIGGFEGHPPPEVYHRWVAFGLFSTHSRLHGSSSYRVPWIYGEDAAKTLAKFLEAKHRLMPYLYNFAIQAHQVGHPVQRAMILEFFDDPTTHHLDRQYTLGPSLLVAPVFVGDLEETEYYVPAGRWTSFFDSSRVVDGPVWIKECVALDEIPLWVRPETVLLLGPEGIKKPDYELNKSLEVRIYELSDGGSVEVKVPSGQAEGISGLVRAERKGSRINVQVVGQAVDIATIVVHLKGFVLRSAKGGKVEEGKAIVAKDTRDIYLEMKAS